MPLIMPEGKYFLALPCAVVGGAARRKSARNCTPCAWSLTPSAARLHELARANGRSVADDRDRIAIAACSIAVALPSPSSAFSLF